MALLDTLTILFKADTAKAEKQIDKLDESIEDVGDSAANADKKVDDFAKEVEKASKNAEGGSSRFSVLASKIIAVAGAAVTASQMVTGAVARADEINRIAQSAAAIGEEVGNVDAFGKALASLGGDAQGARDSLTDMSESIGEALQDVESGRAKVFKRLGVSLRDVSGQAVAPVEAMMRVADAVQGMSQQEAVFRIKELGITDNKTVEAIMKGRKELTRLINAQKEQGVITKEQAARAKLFSESLGALRSSLESGRNSMYDAMLPALMKIVEWLQKGADWVKENSTFVKGFFIGIAAIVAGVYLPTMAAAAAATLAAAAPFILIGALVAAVGVAFGLLYDDVMAFLDGGESVTGFLVNRFRPEIDAVKEGVQNLGYAISTAFENAVAVATDLFEAIANGWSKVKDVWGAVTGFFGGGASADINATMQSAVSQVSAAGSSPLNGQTSSSISNSAVSGGDTSVSVGTVEVKTAATDAQGMAAGAADALRNQLKSLETNSASGVAA